MFDRAADNIIAAATASAAAVLAVFALGFAVYASFVPLVGEPWAATIVAAISSSFVAIYALIAHVRAKASRRAEEQARTEMMNSMPMGVGTLAKEHPWIALAVSLAGGVLAARHPRLARDLVSIVARVTSGRQ